MPSRADVADVLLVEDNPGDVRLTAEALKDARVANRLHVVPDGVEAISFLRRQPGYERVPRPDLILLDLNLPKKDGREVLSEIKSDDELKSIPTVILTTSTSGEDIAASYQLHANSFISKPVDFITFINVVKIIDDFWLGLATLPPKKVTS